MTYRSADSLTYYYYINNDYKNVIFTGKLALEQEIDFYYLRMRIGIAYYENKNYVKAIPHFEKAISMNPADETVQEYLYYSYMFSGRTEDANDWATSFSKNLQNKIKYKPKIIEVVAVGGGITLNDNIALLQDSYNKAATDLYNQITFQGKNNFVNAFLQHKIKNRFHLMYGLSVFNITSRTIIRTTLKNTDQTFNNNQYQCNFGAFYQFRSGWNIGGGVAYYNQSYSTINTTYNYISGYSFSPATTNTSNFSLSARIIKQFGIFKPSLAFATSNFNNSSQIQEEIGITLFPKGNQHLYFGYSNAQILNNTNSQNVNNIYFGGKAFNWWWYYYSLSFGNHLNYITDLGFSTYNSADKISSILNLEWHFYLKNLEIVPTFRVHSYEGMHIYYDNPITYKTRNYIYTNYFLTTTLKWNF
ncbi:MAG: tetratricopeptide repeat protein [Bacteroidota bacterium]|nr:tetratricopeptide repeat protein [Bacteroidota bacterium]